MITQKTISTFLSALLLLCGMTVFTACESEEPNAGADIGEIEDGGLEDGYGSALGAQDVFDNYSQYQGQTVTVSGEVSEVYGQHAFAVGGEGWNDALLVVMAGSTTGGMAMGDTSAMGSQGGMMGQGGMGGMMPTVGQRVQVTGTVRQFIVAEVEREYGFDLDAQVEVEVEEREPMIVAQSVEPMTGMAGGAMMDEHEGAGEAY